MARVSALEDLGEDGEDARAGEVMRDREGEHAVLGEPVLLGGDLHSAAEIFAVGCRRQPNIAVFADHAVDRDGRAAGLVAEHQTAQSDRGVIDRLVRLLPLAVSDLADQTVDADADIVDEVQLTALDSNEGQILDVFGEVEGRVAALLADVVEKVVAASGAVEEDLLLDPQTAGLVDEIVERAVAAREDYDAIVVAGDEKVIKTAQRRDVDKSHLAVGQHGLKRPRLLLGPSVIRHRVVQNTIILQNIILRTF